MKTKKIKLLSTMLMGFSLASSVYATGEGFYLGGQVGYTNTNNKAFHVQTGVIQPSGAVTSPGTITVTPSNTGVGGRLYFGYNVNQYFAMELGGARYANSTYSLPTGVTVISGNPTNKPTIRTSAYDLVGKGMLPIWMLSVFGKLGLAVAQTSTSGSLVTTYSAGQYNVGNTNSTYIRPTAAIGVAYDFTPRWQAELTASRIFKGGGFQNADMFSLGISYHWVDIYCGQFLC